MTAEKFLLTLFALFALNSFADDAAQQTPRADANRPPPQQDNYGPQGQQGPPPQQPQQFVPQENYYSPNGGPPPMPYPTMPMNPVPPPPPVISQPGYPMRTLPLRYPAPVAIVPGMRPSGMVGQPVDPGYGVPPPGYPNDGYGPRPMPNSGFRRMSFDSSCEIQQGNNGVLVVLSADDSVLYQDSSSHAQKNAAAMKAYYSGSEFSFCGKSNATVGI